MSDKLKPYRFHGLIFNREDDEAIADCPFCGKEDHLYISSKGLYSCKVCGQEGNLYTFLREICEQGLEITRQDEYDDLAADRGISSKTLRRHGVCRSPLTDCWMIPTRNEEGEIVNVHVYDDWEGDGKRQLRGTPSISHRLYNIQSAKLDGTRTLWIVEGHWDCMALDMLLRRAKQHKQNDVIATPGVNVWKKEWNRYLEGQDVRIIFDNDWERRPCAECKKPYPTAVETCPNCGGTERKGKRSQPGLDGIKKIARQIL